jgi:hypothetical protein
MQVMLDVRPSQDRRMPAAVGAVVDSHSTC